MHGSIDARERSTSAPTWCATIEPMWQLTLSPAELVLRSVLVYVLFLAALRLSGKRELGQFTIFDLALVLLAANALQPAITGPDASLTAAAIIVVTLFVLNAIVAYVRKHSKVARRILDFAPTTIAENGKWIQAALEKEGLDPDDLEAALREHGLDSIKQVKIAVLEHDGSVSIVPKDGDMVQLQAHKRHYHHKGPAGQ
jgi:uncharacterized membrane protein YcaP (DUF421 family)